MVAQRPSRLEGRAHAYWFYATRANPAKCLKRRSLQTVAAKLGIAGETQDVFYNEHFERFAAYEQELKSLRVNLGQLIKMNKDLLLHKKKTAEQLGCMVPRLHPSFSVFL